MKFSTHAINITANILKRYFYNFLLHSKAYKIFEPFYSGLGSILLFHRVIPEADRITRLVKKMSVTPEYLESCIIYCLQHDYQILSLDEMYDFLKSGRNNKKFVCFTFDDGYIDIYRYAFPLFKKYNLPFAAYITTGFLDEEAIMWWEMLEDLILTKDCLKCAKINNGNSLSCSTWDEKNHLLEVLSKMFTSYKQDELKDILQCLVGLDEFALYKKQKELVASWEQIIEMSNDYNVTIGSHTANHLALKYLNQKEIDNELVKSKEILESKIKRKVEHFSFPFGSKSETGKKEIAILKKHGFKTATITMSGNIFPEHSGCLGLLPRISPQPTIEGFARDVQYLPFWLSGAVPAVRNYGRRVIPGSCRKYRGLGWTGS